MKARSGAIFLTTCLLILIIASFATPSIVTYSIAQNHNKVSPPTSMNQFTWTPPQLVSTVSTAGTLRPDIATDFENNVHVVWEDGTNYLSSGTDIDIFYRRWNATTRSWMTTQVVSTESSSNSHAPEIASDELGNIHVVWRDPTNIAAAGGDWDVFYKIWNRTTGVWGTTEVVSTESGTNVVWLSIAARSGNAFVTWQDPSSYQSSGSDHDIFYKQRYANGTWTLTEVVSTESTAISRFPSITLDSDNNVHITWDDGTNYGGAGIDEDVFYKWKNQTTGVWSTTEVISTESGASSERSKIALDTTGNRHIVWFDVSNYNGAGVDRDIFYKRWNASTSSWTTTEVVSTESSLNSDVPSLVTDINDNVHCFWFDATDLLSSGADADIFYKTWNASTNAWSPLALVTVNRVDDSWRPRVVLDQAQKIHLVWQEGFQQGPRSGISIWYASGYIPSLVSELTIIQSPGVTLIEFSSTGNSLTWILADDNVTNPTYAIYRDGFEILNQSWISYIPITIDVDGLAFGSYNYSIIATDGSGNFVSDWSNLTVANFHPRIVNSPQIIMYPVGATGFTITWTVEDASIISPVYQIRLGATIIETGNWSSGIPISIGIDGLEIGDYTYQLHVQDGYGGETQDSVRVRVTPPVIPFMDILPTLFMGLIIAACPVAITTIIMKRRRP